MTQQKEQHAAFEASYATITHQPISMWGWNATTGEYRLTHARIAWASWQAAIEHSRKVLPERRYTPMRADEGTAPFEFDNGWNCCLDAVQKLSGLPADDKPQQGVNHLRFEGWSKSGIESLCISLDIQQEQSGGASNACAIAASLLRGIAEQQFTEHVKAPRKSEGRIE